MKTLKVLCVHGLGDYRSSPWKTTWPNAIRDSFPRLESIDLTFEFLTYDDIFESIEISAWESTKALAKLFGSGIGIRGQARTADRSIRDRIAWTAGYVVAWVEDAEFRRQTNERVTQAIVDHQPDVLIAHSLGTLITYNRFASVGTGDSPLRQALARMSYVTMGSQIANRFVVGNLTNGRIEALPVKRWTQLFNKEDDVFTERIRLVAPTFEVIDTYFDIQGLLDHEATHYLRHQATITGLYNRLADECLGTSRKMATTSGVAMRKRRKPSHLQRAPRRRALLVGINDYPDPNSRLEGCVNDTYLLSSVLQECSFEAESIRLCLDARATRAGILERMEWLVDGAQPGDELVFGFSGHGARLASYGPEEVVDHFDESLCPYEFNWSPETSITDDEIFAFYSQLPYETRLVMVFDCCHAGGIHRQGGSRVRGLTPPDDVRHRELRWDATTQTWVSRSLPRVIPPFKDQKAMVQYAGQSGAVKRLGRGAIARNLNQSDYEKKKKESGGIVGPYLPLIYEACQEEQLASEYRHGTSSYGAFTWSLAAALRQSTRPTFSGLLEEVRTRLASQGYEQVPQLIGPTDVMARPVPWGRLRTARKPAPPRTTRRSKD